MLAMRGPDLTHGDMPPELYFAVKRPPPRSDDDGSVLTASQKLLQDMLQALQPQPQLVATSDPYLLFECEEEPQPPTRWNEPDATQEVLLEALQKINNVANKALYIMMRVKEESVDDQSARRRDPSLGPKPPNVYPHYFTVCAVRQKLRAKITNQRYLEAARTPTPQRKRARLQ